MKVILSRKGFDSANGAMPSPILPDGTLLSMPIPSEDGITYSDIVWQGKRYVDIIKELNPKSPIVENSRCHLDPDLRESSYPRASGWLPAYGQTGASLTELRKNCVTLGDLFLFFGWFRQTVLIDGKLKYKRQSKDLHVIFGYLQVGHIFEKYEDLPDWLKYHPHANFQKYQKAWESHQNAIFIPTNKLSLNENCSGSGVFDFSAAVTLTKQGYSRTRWEFPNNMRGIEISHNPKGWKKDYFQSSPIGQEFVFNCNNAVIDWLKPMFGV